MADAANNVISLRPAQKASTSESTNEVPVTLLGQGAQGALVRSMQQNLASWGFSPGKVDGIFGAKTAEAVQALQRKLGVPTTGAMDAQTVQKIRTDLMDVASKLKENSANLALRLPEEVAPVTPAAQTSRVAQVAAEEPSNIGKWLFFGALGLGAIYVLTRSNSSSSSVSGSETDGVEEILAALEEPGEFGGQQGKGKNTPPRDPNTGRFLKSEKTITPDDLFDQSAEAAPAQT